MTVNGYLLAQATVAVAAAAPADLSLGQWIALVTLLLVIAGVVYKAGVASQKADNIGSMVVGKLTELQGELHEINEFIKDTQELRVIDARWKADIGVRVASLEAIQPIHTHQRATDR